jgi:tRNA/tmRNA/rRNA uracil-C5-methylase (TrmA/RlmC/RlmD family)
MLDKKVFFQRQIEECRELLRHAVNAEDRAFWQHVAERWEGLLKQIKETAPRKKSEVADNQQRVASL